MSMKSMAALVCVIVATVPPCHLHPEIPPLKVETADWITLSVTLAVDPDCG